MYNVAWIGLGKLGMPCAEVCARSGFKVFGYDIDKSITSDSVLIQPTLEETVRDSDIIFVAVPTPHHEVYDGKTPTSDLPCRDFNYDAVTSVLSELNQLCNKSQIVALVSTVLPGTISDRLLTHTSNYKFVYNPFLIAQGTVAWDYQNPDILMLGVDNKTIIENDFSDLLTFYANILENDASFECGTYEEIECLKVFYNTWITTKITFVNMIQDVAEKLGNIDVDSITSSLSRCSKRITSSAYMKAGLGDGGSCHPRDNIALSYLAEKLDLGYDFFAYIMSIREAQAENMAEKILSLGRKVYFTNYNFKPDVNCEDGSYVRLVEFYVKEHGGLIVDNELNADVIFLSYPSDKYNKLSDALVFDPWRARTRGYSYHYGDTLND